MLIALVSDIHGNLEALQAVLKEIDALGAEDIYCLGDIVGYGPNPHECLGLVRSRCRAVVRGNHDSGAVGRLSLERFNSDGVAGLLYAQRMTHPDHLRFLRHLPYLYQKGDITLVHASPYAPKKFQYVVTEKRVERSFRHFDTSVCFIGHTHIPFLFEANRVFERQPEQGELAYRRPESPEHPFLAVESGFSEELESDEELKAAAKETEQPAAQSAGGYRRLIMVGSVGQPRDGSPRAAFGLFDSKTGEYGHHRVSYDIQKTVDAILKAGLPASLAKRLTRGL